MFNRARWRLTLWFAAVVAVILAVIGVLVFFSTRTSLYDQVNEDLQVRSDRLLRPFGEPGGGPFNPERRDVFQFATAGGYFYVVTGPQGDVFSASEGVQDVHLPTVDQLEAETSDGPDYLDVRTEEGEQVRLYVRPVQAVGDRTYYFQVGRSIESEVNAMRRLFFILGAGGLAGLGLAIAGGYVLAGLAMRPIETAMASQRTFVADASHEIRTPLSLIRANAEMLKRSGTVPADQEYVDDIIKETDRLSYLVGQMLTLARSDSTDVPLELTSVDMTRLSDDAVRQARLLADARQITVSLNTNGPAPVIGDEQRLGELLLILLDNAVKYTDAGGAISVGVAPRDGRVEVAVADNGPGIPAEALPHVFDRFYRADKARSREQGGTGLGLAIAKWIVDAHNGTIRIDSRPGEGTRVVVDLPTSRAAAAAPESPPVQA